MSSIFPTYARWDVTVQKADGAILVDTNDKEYLDFTSGIGVCNLGHNHPTVKEKVIEQLDQVWHVSNLFHIPTQEQAAMMLTEHTCGDYVFFCNSGAEGNEGAIKLARKYTGKWKIISFKQSFHGRTFGSMSATGQDKIHEGYGPLLPSFEYATFNDIDSVKSLVDDQVAAVMIEVIQGEGGVHPADPVFMEALEQLCQENGILLIVDEVQTGIGRTGKAFAYEHYNISPDIIVSAKGLGNGFPIGAVIGKEKLKEAFGPGSHGSTYGGNPLATAAASAVMSEVFRPEFLKQVEENGHYFMKLLTEKLTSSFVKEIKGKGLMIGIECTGEVGPLLTQMREEGFLALSAGPNVIRLLPPLTVTKDQLEKAAAILADVL
ncbi:acetylornithine transaminase [Alkalihalobacterium alkalinitrilicum]|uniref:acetylornithine transaminase n=1 Tax=Alkalihalobacterium alkalinitrilicum TaxID=427920 RepID=UPI0009959009|nr:acetylornithine transaminase [Alkalihalobacterium alkalinitrilicum]